MLCAVTHLAAQQLYTDTFKLQDMNQTVDADALLLDMVAAQTAELYANDSTADTLTYADLMRLDSIAR